MTWDAHTERVLEHVRNRKGWVLMWGRCLRRFSMGEISCPVSDLGDYEPSDYLEAARRAGIPATVAREIATAADNYCTPGHPLRAALLEAAGLSEKGER